jgi:hypothetical protein
MKTYSRHDFTREERAARAKVAISAAFESKEQAFLDWTSLHRLPEISVSARSAFGRNTVEPIVRLVVAVWAERSLPMADLKGGPKTT